MLIWRIFFSSKFLPFYIFHIVRYLCSVLFPVNQMYIPFFLIFSKIFFELCHFHVFLPADTIHPELFLFLVEYVLNCVDSMFSSPPIQYILNYFYFWWNKVWIVSIPCFLSPRSNISWIWRGGGFVWDSGGGTIKVIKANTKIAQTQISTIKYKFEK